MVQKMKRKGTGDEWSMNEKDIEVSEEEGVISRTKDAPPAGSVDATINR